MSPPRIHSTLDVKGEPTSAEECVARQEATALLESIRPAVVAMILGKPAPFYIVDHVSPAGLLQLVITRTVVP